MRRRLASPLQRVQLFVLQEGRCAVCDRLLSNDFEVDLTAAYAVRRLRKDRPDLHGRVLDGELSANAAMIEAGFRKPGKSRALPPVERAWKIVSALSHDDQEVIRQRLSAVFFAQAAE